MKAFVSCLAAGLAALAASSASAAVHTVYLTGTVLSQQSPGTDPNIAVGDKVVLTGTFDDNAAPTWGSFGYKVGFIYNPSFKVTLNGLTWIYTDEIYDNATRYTYDYYVEDAQGNIVSDHRDYGNPSVIFNGTNILGASGKLSPAGSSARPLLDLGSIVDFDSGFDGYTNFFPGGPIIHVANFSPTTPSSFFQIIDPNGLYGNTYATPGFVGQWDFSRSFVTNVPESATWTMLLLGVATLGGALRANRGLLRIRGRRQSHPQGVRANS